MKASQQPFVMMPTSREVSTSGCSKISLRILKSPARCYVRAGRDCRVYHLIHDGNKKTVVSLTQNKFYYKTLQISN